VDVSYRHLSGIYFFAQDGAFAHKLARAGRMETLKNLYANAGTWSEGLPANAGPPEVWMRVIVMGLGGLALALVPVVAVIFLVWAERKIVARMQGRLGPNNSGAYGGTWGILQTFADALKLLVKEDVIPAAADRCIFNAAPVLILAIAVLIWAVIPLGEGLIGADLNIGILYVLFLGLGKMVAMLMAGWGSNNKYALLGALRAIAQMISYEIPLVLAVLVVVMVTGSFSMQDIIEAQDIPFLFTMPVTALLFFVASLAEVGRLPFDLAEADSELVAGYFVEYSGMKFGQFYLAEFMSSFAFSAITAVLFLGGWRGPFAASVPILGSVWLLLKTVLVFFVLMWLRGTLPRLRIDQMLKFNWTFLVPVALANICVTALAVKAVPSSASPWVEATTLLGTNILLALAVLGILVVAGRRARQRSETRTATQLEAERRHLREGAKPA
jgi:NADH-quinone oxidoreductase subunit H